MRLPRMPKQLPVEKDCEQCNERNIYISPRKSYRCSHCLTPLDWRLKIICNECGVSNHLNREERRNARCHACFTLLSNSYSKDEYVPNRISWLAQILMFGAFMVLFTASYQMLVNGEVVVPFLGGRTRDGLSVFVSGVGIVLPMLSLLLSAIGCLSHVIDHYDKRQNEHAYLQVQRFCLLAGYLLLMLSPLVGSVVWR